MLNEGSNMLNLQHNLPTVLHQLKHDANIAIIYAGDPSVPENVLFRSTNPRSWKSYQLVASDIRDALIRLGFKHVRLLKENKKLAANLDKYAITFAWLNTAGVQGHDSSCHCAALLESVGIPYVGHTPAKIALMDNKHLFKMYLQSEGIATAPYLVWHPKTLKKISLHPQFKHFIQTLSQNSNGEDKPRYIVKPVCGRASLNVHIAESINQLNALCQKVYNDTGNAVLIEQFLPGREYCIAVMGEVFCEYQGSDDYRFRTNSSPLCFALFERVLENPNTISTSMDTNAISTSSVKPLHPVNEAQLIQLLKTIAEKVYCGLDLNNIIRLDLRMDQNGKLHVLEANPKPDLKASNDKSTSLISLGLDQLEIDYDMLILNQLSNTLSSLYRPRT